VTYHLTSTGFDLDRSIADPSDAFHVGSIARCLFYARMHAESEPSRLNIFYAGVAIGEARGHVEALLDRDIADRAWRLWTFVESRIHVQMLVGGCLGT